jgi:CcmD family protein
MQNLPYLFATYAIVWLVLFGYLFVVASQMRAVRRDVDQIKERLAGSVPATTVAEAERSPPRGGSYLWPIVGAARLSGL